MIIRRRLKWLSSIGSAAEAADFVQKGMDAKVLSGDRATKLLNTAKAQDASEQARFAKLAAAADKARTGDDAINLGEEMTGAGRYQDAINEIQKGIQKGVTDKGDAQIELGIAYLGAGPKGRRDPTHSALFRRTTPTTR